MCNSPINAILNVRRSPSTSRKAPIEVVAAKKIENNKNEALKNVIEALNKQVKPIKTAHYVVSQIPIKRQLLLYLPSRLTSHKTTVENTQKT